MSEPIRALSPYAYGAMEKSTRACALPLSGARGRAWRSLGRQKLVGDADRRRCLRWERKEGAGAGIGGSPRAASCRARSTGFPTARWRSRRALRSTSRWSQVHALNPLTDRFIRNWNWLAQRTDASALHLAHVIIRGRRGHLICSQGLAEVSFGRRRRFSRISWWHRAHHGRPRCRPARRRQATRPVLCTSLT